MSARTLTELVTFVGATLTAAGDASPCLEGAEHLSSHETMAPRYVFLSRGGRATHDIARRTSKELPDLCAVYVETVEVHVWGYDHANRAATDAKTKHRDAAVMMLGNLHTALEIACGDHLGDLKFEQWSFIGQDDPRWTDNGAVIVFRFTLPVPVPRGIRPIVAFSPSGDLTQTTTVIPSTHTEAEMQTSHDPDPPVYYEQEPGA